MEMIENKQTQKRRMPAVAKIALAAALAVGCVLSIAAGLPAQVYNFVTGGTLVITSAEDDTILDSSVELTGEMADPIVLEDGRLWFVNGEERTDVTDLIDADTPYIYEHTDPATGNKGYVILGGTVDDFGWAECIKLGNVSNLVGNNSFDCFVTLDGQRIHMSDLPEDQMDQLEVPFETVYRPWLERAIEQLGLELD